MSLARNEWPYCLVYLPFENSVHLPHSPREPRNRYLVFPHMEGDHTMWHIFTLNVWLTDWLSVGGRQILFCCHQGLHRCNGMPGIIPIGKNVPHGYFMDYFFLLKGKIPPKYNYIICSICFVFQTNPHIYLLRRWSACPNWNVPYTLLRRVSISNKNSHKDELLGSARILLFPLVVHASLVCLL